MKDYVRVIVRLEETIGCKRVADRNRHAASRSEALILADQILNRLNGYARRGSRARRDFYSLDLNWIADVLMRVQASDRDPLRPTGQ